MTRKIARTVTDDAGTNWLVIPTHVLYDWVLRIAPAAALESAGRTDDAARIRDLRPVTESVLTRPRPLKRHARLLRETDRTMSDVLSQVATQQPPSMDPARVDPEKSAWDLFMTGASEICREYSDAGQYALATVNWAKERASFTGETFTFVDLFQRSYADMVYAAQVWGYNDFLAEISWEPKRADLKAALEHVGLTAAPGPHRSAATRPLRA